MLFKPVALGVPANNEQLLKSHCKYLGELLGYLTPTQQLNKGRTVTGKILNSEIKPQSCFYFFPSLCEIRNDIFISSHCDHFKAKQTFEFCDYLTSLSSSVHLMVILYVRIGPSQFAINVFFPLENFSFLTFVTELMSRFDN